MIVHDLNRPLLLPRCMSHCFLLVYVPLLSHISADPLRFGLAYNHFGGGEEGEEACRAIQSLVDISRIDTMLSNFILPLQQMADKDGRVHCSLNLNTETGRLSARRPNLQVRERVWL